jgi:hypothetical protein
MVKSRKKLRRRAELHEKKDERAVDKVVDGGSFALFSRLHIIHSMKFMK